MKMKSRQPHKHLTAGYWHCKVSMQQRSHAWKTRQAPGRSHTNPLYSV